MFARSGGKDVIAVRRLAAISIMPARNRKDAFGVVGISVLCLILNMNNGIASVR